MRHRPLIPICLALVAGILIGDRLTAVPPPRWAAAMAAVVATVAIGFARDRRITWAAVVLFTGSVGLIFAGSWVHPVFGRDHIAGQMDAGPQTITGRVVGTPRLGVRRVSMIVEATARRKADIWSPANGRIRVTVGGTRIPPVDAGDRVRFTARLSPIVGFRNPGGFDFARYMAFQGVWTRSWVRAERLFVWAHAAEGTARWWPSYWRPVIGRWLDDRIGGDAAAIIQSLVTGDRRQVAPRIKERFNRLGISHLLAISGLHMGIIALVSFQLARWLLVRVPHLVRRGWVGRAAALSTLPPLLIYGVLAGLSPATQRALVMALIVMVALMTGRRHDLFSALAAAALVILLCRPQALFAVSFQFSFGAVASIAAGMSLVRPAAAAPAPVLPSTRLTAWLKSSLWVSLLANLGTLPLAMVYFQQVSLVGCLTNLVFVPLFGFLVVPMALAGVALLLLIPQLAHVLLVVAAAIVNGGLALASVIDSVSWISVTTFVPTIAELGLYYAFGGWVLYWIGCHREANGKPIPGAGVQDAFSMRPLAAVLIMGLSLLSVDGIYWMQRRFWHQDLRVTFLDVGQGSAAVVAFPGGATMVVDGGGSAMPGAFDVGAGVVAPFLHRERIFTIDTMVLTHANSDHLNGLLHIAEAFTIGACWHNGEAADTAGYRRFTDILDRRHIPQPDYDSVFGRHRFGVSDVSVLYPPPAFAAALPTEGKNDHSIVMKISCQGNSVLLTGDITAPAEAELVTLQGSKLAANVLQAPHHGSATSSSPGFIEAVSPKAVVISAGWRNRFGLPHPDVLSRYRRAGAALWRIDTGGAVSLTINRRKWRCRQHGQPLLALE